MASRLLFNSSLLVLFFGSAIRAQEGITLAAHPGYAYSPVLGSGSFGGRITVVVPRTATIQVGAEVGFFFAGADSSTLVAHDPVFGVVRLTEQREHSFWFVAAAARYELLTTGSGRMSVVLTTGVYRLQSRETLDERDLSGNLVRAGHHEHGSQVTVPGVGLGAGYHVASLCNGLGLDLEARVHSLVGVVDVIYPVVTLTAGLRTQL